MAQPQVANAAVERAGGISWSLEQPIPRSELIDPVVRHYERYLPRYLGEKVRFQEVGKGEYLQGVHRVLASRSVQHSIVLLSPSLLGYLHEERLAKKAPAPLSPLQLVLERPWCLVGASSLDIKSGEDFVGWLRGLKRPVRINLISKDGLPSLWLKAMQSKTKLAWNVSTYPRNAEKSLESIALGEQDLALELCPEVTRLMSAKASPAWRDRVKVLATASEVPELSDKVPSFAQWHLPTITPSWVAWFASSHLPADQQKRLADALYQVTMREDTQALIRGLYQRPVSMTPQVSQTYIANWLSNWQSIGGWLKSLPVDTAASPAGQRLAKPATSSAP